MTKLVMREHKTRSSFTALEGNNSYNIALLAHNAEGIGNYRQKYNE